MIEVKEVTPVSNAVFSAPSFMDHEQVVFCYDKATGLKAIIAIHNTTLGPALGGTRMWKYASEAEAINDVLRLSRGMTYKASISGLQLGGGKAVIIGDAKKEKTPELFRAYGRFIETLNGKYISAEDVGTSVADMEQVRKETKHVTGLAEGNGGSGDPSPVTAYGVYMGMKASAKEMWGNDSLNGKIVAVQGVGHVGENLVRLITSEGAKVYITDINQDQLAKVSKEYGATVVSKDDIYEIGMDIYAPCALGATVNTATLAKLKCAIIAGAANNQLENEDVHAKLCAEKGILYAPDFLINAGGLINVFSEIKGYDRNKSMDQTQKIYDTTLSIFAKAKAEKITTAAAAKMIAEERIAAAKK
ncbi:MAG: hypothetical protein RIQ89_946 [Bacteroidota bacterium]|jgi:leucine dehydrogenase